MRLFGSERVYNLMEKLGVDEDTPIDAKMLSGAIENAQKQVESRNFQTRKNVLQYDDVMNLGGLVQQQLGQSASVVSLQFSVGQEQVSGGEEHGTEVGYRLPEVLSVQLRDV